MLYEKFGEFDSAEEINEAAKGQLEEGTEESKENIMKIAEENGISKEDAADFIDGYIPELCTDYSAALGKLEVEKEYLELHGAELDYAIWLMKECAEDAKLRAAVRRKTKSLAGAIGVALKAAWESKKRVHPEIIEAAGLGSARVESGTVGTAEAVRLMREYYLGGTANETD